MGMGANIPQRNSMASKAIRILLVDDHQDTVFVGARILTMAGYTVVSAFSAEEARKAADDHSFHLLVSDISLPGASGLQLMRDLKAKYGTRGIPVSGHALDGDGAEAKAAGFSLFITKPVAWAELLKGITALTEAGPCTTAQP